MSKKLILASVVLAMALAGSASAVMIAHWSMDDNAANTVVKDSVDGQNDGTFIDPVDPTTQAHHVDGVFGGALNFIEGDPPRGDYIDVPYDAGLEFGSGPYSISVWIRQSPGGGIEMTPGGDQDVFIGKMPGWLAGVWKVGFDGTTLKYEHQVCCGFVDGGLTAGYQNNLWHHVVVVKRYTGADGAEIWVDGDLEGTGEARDLSLLEHPIQIGRQGHDVVTAFYKGDLDDIALFNHALSGDEINDLRAYGAAFFASLAWDPHPAVGEENVWSNTKLRWRAPYDPNAPDYQLTSYDVYYSKDPCMVADVTHVATGSGVTEIQPPLILDMNEEYFWRVDTTHPVSGLREGDLWHFTTGGDVCDPQLIADIYGTDCVVDIGDFAILASHWLGCTRINRPCP